MMLRRQKRVSVPSFVMYYIYGRVRAIPTYRVYQLYDIARDKVVTKFGGPINWANFGKT